jgi:hypothetical protein
MAKDGGGSGNIINIVLLVGGAAAAYWYITNYGPQGAVYGANGAATGAVSWWNTWFGTGTTTAAAALPPASTVPVTTPTQPIATAPIIPTPVPVPAPVPVVAAPQPLSIPSNFTVTPDINGAYKGTVLINGVPTTLDVIIANIGQPSGVVWNTDGTDVTNMLPAGVLGPLTLAYQQAAGTGSMALSGIVPAFMATGQALGVGAIPSMSFGKGFAGGFSGRRKSTGPMRMLLN